MFRGTRSNKTVFGKAAEWNVKLDSGEVSERERAEFHAWLEVPRHARAFEQLRVLQSLVEDLGPEYKAEAERSLFTPKSQSMALTGLFARPVWVSALAAAAVLFAVIAGWSTPRTAFIRSAVEHFSHAYASDTGEVRSIALPDGSIAWLNTQTRLKWIGKENDRRVLLLAGEALFDVMPDPSRPFRIILDRSEVRVLGTRFNVYKKSNGDVLVTVLSGKVAVDGFDNGSAVPAWSELVTANKQIEYAPSGSKPTVRSADAPKVVRWREGLLEAQEEFLPSVIDEFRRYTKERILVDDPRLETERVGGAFRILNVPAALRLLEQSAPVTVKHGADGYTLTYRSETSLGTEAKGVGNR